jgi:hypothetical protein
MRRADPTDLDRYFERIEHWLPAWFVRGLRWLRRPASWWARIPLALIFLLGGVLSFLPVLGLWMLPLGLLLLTQDLPFLRRPTARLLGWIEAAIRRGWWRPKNGGNPR